MEAEREAIKSEAKEYDQLLAQPGWAKLLQVMLGSINSELDRAMDAEIELEPEKQKLRVVRGIAMRKLLDKGLAHINTVRAERDRIEAEDTEWQTRQRA